MQCWTMQFRLRILPHTHKDPPRCSKRNTGGFLCLPPTLAGLFFCLAPAESAGLFFFPGGVSATHKRLPRLFFRPCNYTYKAPKPFTELYRGVSVDLRHSRARNTAATQAAYTPTAPRWRAYPQAQHLHRYQITPTHRTLYRAEQPPIIIWYRGAPVRPVMDPCPEVQHSADHASGSGSVHPACIRLASCAGSAPGIWRSGCLLTGIDGQGQRADLAAGGRRRNHWRLAAASLFGLSPDSQ